MSDSRQVSIVAVYGNGQGQADVLLNVYEPPLEPEAIISCIHSVAYDDEGLSATSLFDVDHWLTHMHRRDDWIATCSMDGHIHYFDGIHWQTLQTTAEDGFNAVFVASPGSIYAAALDGSIRLIENHHEQIVSAAGGKRLNALHGCASDCLYAVGDGGRVVHFDGSRWSEIEPFTNINLLDVLWIADDQIVIAGAKGGLWIGHGDIWQQLDAFDYTITSLAVQQGQIWLAAGANGVFKLDGDQLQESKQAPLYRLAANDAHLMAVGGEIFAWWDGHQWQGWRYEID
ncbi:hypothetical protein K5Q02_05925 [Pseudomonas sp. MM211]|uniref:hypothetical protein n=1 Tax=Pseudomonas sp. MM211 TaxID=2866808 RepID=UPI001CEDC47E|nr:hypothetical protein [Pseudomonas sp. MM211]UCJ17909.1 hypothetical protein K5Q02_05925 [Pseudomonas sp. MM211]